jgi:AcrR family transcriptional regulator
MSPVRPTASREDSSACASESTQQRLLDAAERLFVEHGFEGASMRALAERAGTSVSAANYHFGGKQALMRAVLVRRLEPLNARRIEALDQVVQVAAPDPPALEPVLEAFFRPSLEAWREGEAAGRPRVRHILAQLHADPHELSTGLKAELFGPLFTRYVDVLCGILPDQSRGEVRVGMSLVVGVLLQVIGGHFDENRDVDLHATETGGEFAEPVIDPAEDERLLARLIAFAAAGLRAKTPVPAERRERGGRS